MNVRGKGLFWLIPAVPILLIVAGTAVSSGWQAMVNPGAAQRDLFRPVLLACQAELRARHPRDAALRIDLNDLGMSRYVQHGTQRQWTVDGVMELRGERTSFDCDATGSGQELRVTFVTSLLWATPPPD